jgi:8-amino-7-oxononanoate synthase
MTDSLAWIDEELSAWEALGLRRLLVDRVGRQGAEIEVGDRKLVNFGSNDYLGLAGTTLSSAVIDAVERNGWGSGASPLVAGHGTLHASLEAELARFEGTEAALLFPTGFAANLGTVAALAGKGDVIFSDANNHASLIDGCRLSGARIVVYPHRDLGYLDKMLQQAARFRRRLIVTDGLFSMDGDLAPLPELVGLADRHQTMLLVDEAHGTGVFGAQGRGISEHYHVEDRIPIRIGTLSKALGSVGGFVVGSRPLIEWLVNRARPYVFSTAPPEAVAAGGLRALQIVRDEPHRRRELLATAASVRDRLRQDGWPVGEPAGQIIPVWIGNPEATMQLAQSLRDRGLFVPGIRPPSVPDGQSRLRISLSYAHTPDHIQQLVHALAQLRTGGVGLGTRHPRD